jgi:hypothetical protein
MICPLSAGVIVAVDLTKRSLLWAYRYPRDGGNVPQSAGAGRVLGFAIARGVVAQTLGAPNNNTWGGSAATISGGKVLLTPVDSNQIHCLSLLDGSVAWTRPRENYLYCGGVQNGQVLLVGQNGMSALSLENGESLASVTFPDGGRPSGRGYLSEDSYFVPLSTAEVVRVELASMSIAERAKSRDGDIPGNLICHGDEVISQGVDFLETYYQIEPLPPARSISCRTQRPRNA